MKIVDKVNNYDNGRVNHQMDSEAIQADVDAGKAEVTCPQIVEAVAVVQETGDYIMQQPVPTARLSVHQLVNLESHPRLMPTNQRNRIIPKPHILKHPQRVVRRK